MEKSVPKITDWHHVLLSFPRYGMGYQNVGKTADLSRSSLREISFSSRWSSIASILSFPFYVCMYFDTQSKYT